MCTFVFVWVSSVCTFIHIGWTTALSNATDVNQFFCFAVHLMTICGCFCGQLDFRQPAKTKQRRDPRAPNQSTTTIAKGTESSSPQWVTRIYLSKFSRSLVLCGIHTIRMWVCNGVCVCVIDFLFLLLFDSSLVWCSCVSASGSFCVFVFQSWCVELNDFDSSILAFSVDDD